MFHDNLRLTLIQQGLVIDQVSHYEMFIEAGELPIDQSNELNMRLDGKTQIGRILFRPIGRI
jgi:hypothetical protein